MSRFSYLIEKIEAADFSEFPFRHIYLDDFFSPADFAEITTAPEIALSPAESDAHLFSLLFERGYKIIDFPGCITDQDRYIRWHAEKKIVNTVTNTACEGFGVTLRLIAPKTPFISELKEFLSSDRFQTAAAAKFGISSADVYADNGIQKYLDGYEISPHPDVRKKALTYMVNINPHRNSEELDHHTHYLKFRDQYRYIENFWQHNPDVDRCWFPWGWCESKSIQTRNNSIVLFSPSNNTMHGVKTNYDHLPAQRTQLYGNLWYHNVAFQTDYPGWEDYVIGGAQRHVTPLSAIKSRLPAPIKALAKQVLAMGGGGSNVIDDRIKHHQTEKNEPL